MTENTEDYGRIIVKKLLSLLLFALLIAGLYGAWKLWGEDLLYGRAEGHLARDAALELPIREGVARLEEHPEDADARLALVELYLQDDNYARAENLLQHGILLEGGRTAFYTKLCAVFVAQDKLLDAAALLDEVQNPFAKAEIAALRPAAPVFSPPPGSYDTVISISAELPAGASCYLALNDEIPSRTTDLAAFPLTLPPGLSRVRAVIVDELGLISPWAAYEYRLENLRLEVTPVDPTLNAMIRQAVAIPEGAIPSETLWTVESLKNDAPTAYTTLEDLTWVTGLRELSLRGDGTKVDIAPLASLQNLTSLTLRGFQLDSSDLQALAGLSKLESLNLEDNRIADPAALSGLTGLTFLSLRANSLTDLSALSGLVSLTELDISQNAAEDTMPLAGLTALKTLWAQENQLVDLRGLRTLAALTDLDISHNKIDDLAPLTGCAALTVLQCGHNPYATLAPLAACTSLVALRAPGGALESLDDFTGLPALRMLDLSEHSLSDISALAACPALEELNLSKNQISSVSPLSKLAKLRVLHVENNQVKAVSSLKKNPALREVHASGNPLSESGDVFKGTEIMLYS